MFDGVMILVLLILEHNLSTLEELVEQTSVNKEVAVIPNAYH